MVHLPSPRSQQRLALLTYVKLMRAANAARNFASRSLADSGLTLTQFAVLEALYHLGPMSLTDIAQKVLTTGGNLTMVVGNLGKAGLGEAAALSGRPACADRGADGKGQDPDAGGVSPSMRPPSPQFLGVLSPEEQLQLGELCRKLGKQEQS